MDLLAIFRSSPEKQIQKARKRIKEPHGDPAPRINAAHKLYEIGTPEAILALLDRFKINVSPSRQDEEEKEEVLGWIVSFGEKAVPPLIRFLKTERQVYWPIRALREILQEEELVREVNSVLTHHYEHPPASPEPQVQLLRALRGVYSPELEKTVRLHLKEKDDDLRLAALDYLFDLPEGESREGVLECYANSEDRPRIRSYVLDRLAETGWSVSGYRPTFEETLPEGYTLTREGTVKILGREQ